MRNTIKGVLTAIVTPFDADGDLNLPGLTRQIARQLDAGNGIFCGGTNGEFFVLSVPIYLYNIPARTGNTIEPDTARALAEHPNIIGIKDSAGSYESLSGFLNAVKDIDGFDVLNGPDSLIHQGFIDGCSACISGLANVAPAAINAIWSRFNAGDIDGSRRAQESVTQLRTELYSVAFSPAAVKKALQIMGEDVGESRYAVAFNAQQLQQIRQIVTASLN